MPNSKKAHQATREGPHTIRVESPVAVKERQARDNELVNRGFSMEMLYGGNPKVDYYRHAPAMKPTRPGQEPRIQTDVNGKPDGNVGKLIPNQPGDPDTAMKLSARGVLPWEPGSTCQCKACREEYGTERTGDHVVPPSDIHKFQQPGNVPSVHVEQPAEEAQEAVAPPPVAVAPAQPSCLDCDFVPKKGKNPVASLRAHRLHKHRAA